MPRKVSPRGASRWEKAIKNSELGGSADTCIDVTLMSGEIVVVVCTRNLFPQNFAAHHEEQCSRLIDGLIANAMHDE
jgi:hypothetical protein